MADRDRVLVRGAGGGIGLMCVQFAAVRCDAVTATSSSELRGEALRGLGASSIWHRTSGGPLAPASFDVIIDTVVGDEWPSYFDRLESNGRYLMCGGIGGMPPRDFGMKILEHFHKSPTLYAFSLNSIALADIEREATILWNHVQAGRILPVVHSVLPLSKIVAAHRMLDAGDVFGKIVLVPD
jgi:NADPH:quinone reductase-like Zn-dependent oxidoreductase